jgi:hypothetical protein
LAQDFVARRSKIHADILPPRFASCAKIPRREVGEISAIRILMERYKEAPMDFADACVVRMAELNSKATVCTTDGHFRFYRKSSGEMIAWLAPFAG